MGLENFFSGLGPSVTGAGSLTPLEPLQWQGVAERLARAGLWVHIDIMDGVFTPRPGVPIKSLGWLRHRDLGSVDVHLMVDQLDDALTEVLPLAPQRVTVHVERILTPPAPRHGFGQGGQARG